MGPRVLNFAEKQQVRRQLIRNACIAVDIQNYDVVEGTVCRCSGNCTRVQYHVLISSLRLPTVVGGKVGGDQGSIV